MFDGIVGFVVIVVVVVSDVIRRIVTPATATAAVAEVTFQRQSSLPFDLIGRSTASRPTKTTRSNCCVAIMNLCLLRRWTHHRHDWSFFFFHCFFVVIVL